jgi:hypothetical protein
VSRLHILARTATLSVLLASFVLTGCHSSSRNSAPTVAFSKVAAAYQENPYKTDMAEDRDYKRDIIEGRATGARTGQRIVLYAKTDGRWGVCRQSGQPSTNIEADGRWKASVHLGMQYAALLRSWWAAKWEALRVRTSPYQQSLCCVSCGWNVSRPGAPRLPSPISRSWK